MSLINYSKLILFLFTLYSCTYVKEGNYVSCENRYHAVGKKVSCQKIVLNNDSTAELFVYAAYGKYNYFVKDTIQKTPQKLFEGYWSVKNDTLVFKFKNDSLLMFNLKRNKLRVISDIPNRRRLFKKM